MTKEYITVSLPKALIKKIDNLLEKKELGYVSRPEVIKDAIRRRLEELEDHFELKEELIT